MLTGSNEEDSVVTAAELSRSIHVLGVFTKSEYYA